MPCVRSSANIAGVKMRTTIDLDQELLRDAADALGTTRATDTIHVALGEAVPRRRHERLAARELPDLAPGSVDTIRSRREFTSALPRVVQQRTTRCP
jgi:Arc/MetJ family transcription regulator